MIKIEITEYNFEHDLYSLVRAFYPGEAASVSIIPLENSKVHYVRIGFYDDELVNKNRRIEKKRENLGMLKKVMDSEQDEATDELIQNKLEQDPDEFDGIKPHTVYEIKLWDARKYAALSRIELKTYVKRCVYEELSKQTDIKLAWGTLTGIRPAKLAMALLEENIKDDEIRTYLKEHYLVSEQKSKLCLDVAKKERSILSKTDLKNSYSLYIGIPFCPSRCLYCSFTSFPLDKWASRVDEYVDTLCKELKFVSENSKGKKLTSIYMGGGTPSTLSPAQMDKLLNSIEEYFNITVGDNGNADNNVSEFTVEAGRPDSITKELLKVLYEHGIRRISINPQTMQQKTLTLIGRKHSVNDVYRAFTEAHEVGFDNINVDIIVGLPGETFADLKDTMRQVKELSPESLTVHSLAIKRAAKLNTMRETYSRYKITNTQEMIDYTYDTALEMGLEPYYMYRQKNMAGNFENVGYTIPGKECIYNVLIMEEKQTIIACGAGASSKIVIPEENRVERVENVKDVGQYLERIDEMIKRKEPWLCR